MQQLPTFSGPHCVVEFPFNAEDSSELSLNKGDVVELVERVGGDWLRGRLAGKEGIFPANFVNIIKDLPPAPTLGPNVAAAVADFDGMEGELSFKVRGAFNISQLSFALSLHKYDYVCIKIICKCVCKFVRMYICAYVCTCRLVSTSL